MNDFELKKICNRVVSEYWSDFKAGNTWNYFLDSSKYSNNDEWASMSQWKSAAEFCIENDSNVIQALEVLLAIDSDKYMDLANERIAYWYSGGAHDAYYYFDILSHFPKEDKIREQFLGEKEYGTFIESDGWGYNSSARNALLKSDDSSFREFLGDWVSRKLSAEYSLDTMEDDIFPLLVELGRYSKKYLSDSNIKDAKLFVQEFLDNDKKSVESILNGKIIDYEDRSLWIADNAGYFSWALGWQDIIDQLKTSDWYWASIFSDLWSDEDNKNLVAWSLVHNDQVIRSRALEVIKSGSVDGAIALMRLEASIS